MLNSSRRGATFSGQEITDRDEYKAALLAGAVAEAERDGERTKLGAAFIRDARGADALSKLSRYETAIERSAGYSIPCRLEKDLLAVGLAGVQGGSTSLQVRESRDEPA